MSSNDNSNSNWNTRNCMSDWKKYRVVIVTDFFKYKIAKH